jgi:maltooligosyltrehalose trehalohydrolase
LDWTEVGTEPHASLLAWHKALIRLRGSRSELSDGDLNAVVVRFDEAGQWLVMQRRGVAVACNLGQGPVELEMPAGGEIILASDESIRLGGARLTLGPDSVAVVAG